MMQAWAHYLDDLRLRVTGKHKSKRAPQVPADQQGAPD